MGVDCAHNVGTPAGAAIQCMAHQPIAPPPERRHRPAMTAEQKVDKARQETGFRCIFPPLRLSRAWYSGVDAGCSASAEPSSHLTCSAHVIKMSRLLPMPKADELGTRISDFTRAVTDRRKYNQFSFRKLISECDDLAKTNAIDSSLNKSILYEAIGDIDEAMYWIKNARRCSPGKRFDLYAASALCNNGRINDAHELVPSALSENSGIPFASRMPLAVTTCSFSAVLDAVAASRAKQEVVSMTSLLDLCQAASNAICDLGQTEANLRNIVDQAGKVMSDRHLVWVGDCADVNVVSSGGAAPSILFSFGVEVSPDVAAEMNWELAGRIANLEIDSNGFGVDFIGLAS